MMMKKKSAGGCFYSFYFIFLRQEEAPFMQGNPVHVPHLLHMLFVAG